MDNKDDSLFIVHFAGKALTFIKEKVLTWESGMRRGVPKLLVVVTDGRSQDEVRKAATVIQHSGKQFTAPGCFFSVLLQLYGNHLLILYGLRNLFWVFGKTSKLFKEFVVFGPKLTFSLWGRRWLPKVFK